MNKIYKLNLSPDYCRDWIVEDAIREVLQNSLDSVSTFQYGYEGDTLHLTSVGVQLAPSTLLLGNSTKSDDKDSVGGFGEGYKLALLVLLREGHEVTILNGDKIWTPKFIYDEQYESEMLCVEESPYSGNGNLTFIIGGVSQDLLDEVSDRCLYLQEDLGETLDGSAGRILLGKAGKLYVGGLYVTDTHMQYSYDFNPDVLKLNRDRKSVENWNLEYETSRLWNDVSDASTVAKMLFESCPDVRLAKHTSSQSTTLKTECYSLYKEKYGQAPIASDTWDKDEMEEDGYKDVVVTGNSSFTELVKQSQEYKDIDFDKEEKEEEKSPLDLLEELYDDIEHISTNQDQDQFICDFKELYQELEERGIKWE